MAGVPAPTCVVAIDAGTTGIRSRAVFADARPAVAAYREFTQHFPRPGWVEHDAVEIWDAVRATLAEVIERIGRDSIAAIGITNQRETVRRLGPHDRRSVRSGDRVAGPAHGRTVRRAHRCRRARSGAGADRAGARPLLQRHQVRVAAERGGCAPFRRSRPRHHRRLGHLEPHRRRAARDGRDQRQPDDALRHRPAGVGRRAVPSCCTSRWRRSPRSSPSSGRVGRDDRRRRRAGGHPDQRHRRRPAGGPVRPGVRLAGHGQEHVRHRQLRAAQRRRGSAHRRRRAC